MGSNPDNQIKFERTDGGGVIFDGVHYESLLDMVMIGVFGFCNCGRPTDVAKFIVDSLDLIEKRYSIGENGYENEDWRREAESLFGTTGQEYFMYYWLDSKGYTEHNGRVPGWTTAEGDEIVELLRKALAEEEMEVDEFMQYLQKEKDNEQ